METKPILEIHKLSKKFAINVQTSPYLTFRDSLLNILKFKKTLKSQDFWALKEISFEVQSGETIGIIGKNGAGKSTLLKVLSRITPPTKGSVISRGRIASLLEVGTGFHPELSGRENIFLNGSILGMRRKEIIEKFDEIVDFAGVELFLDTPLKHYSSGMQLRLAFAVAAFLNPEVLIIDEVLAVGDAEFQKKCIQKMDQISQDEARTILFVSHNLGLVSQLCTRCIWLKEGEVHQIGETADIIQNYILSASATTKEYHVNPEYASTKEVCFLNLYSCNKDLGKSDSFGFDEHLHLRLDIKNTSKQRNLKVGVSLIDKFGNLIFTLVENIEPYMGQSKNDITKLKIKLPANLIAPNNYSFRYALFVQHGKVYEVLENETPVSIIETGSSMSAFEGINYGSIIINSEWESLAD